jgi:peptidoglycan/xylan/chitin deacetylase (PgdA/CDA1 family)
MRHSSISTILTALLIVFGLTGCSVVSALAPTSLPTATLTPTLTSTPLPTVTPTLTPTPTEVPFYIKATVFSGNLQAPILLYHHFVPDTTPESTSTKTRLADFKDQLQKLYDAGFSLVSLQSWLDGNFIVPEGRKPLVLTLDDGWFADQIYINEDGTPNPLSGMGVLWQFSQDHPDFGFTAAIFTNMGDKFYADQQVGDRFILGAGDAWKNKFGNTIAWAIEHGIEPYNHTYTHVQLNLCTNSDIIYQLKQNDYVTRTFLERVGRSDLIPHLGNIIALPFGQWPSTGSGIKILQNYKDPEGLQTEAIMEAYNLYEAKFTPSVFSPDFSRFALPRLTAGKEMIQTVVDSKDQFPTAQSCALGPLPESQQGDMTQIPHLIDQAVASGTCPAGIYNVNGTVFTALHGSASLFFQPTPAVNTAEPAFSPTPTP